MANRSFVAVCAFLAASAVAGCASPSSAPSADRSITRAAESSPALTPTPVDADTARPSPTPAGDAGTTGDAGIKGITVVDGCPVKLDPPCPDKPISARLSVLSVDGSVLATVDTGANGTFTISIEPGQYVLRPMSSTGALPRPPEPFAVNVEPNHYTTVTVRFDSGMR
jgi:hypothetical protein